MPYATPTTQVLDLLWQSRWLVAILLAVGAARLAFALSRPGILGWLGERRVRAALDGMGVENLNDVYLRSRDGVTQVDHVARLGGILLVIETKNYSGLVVGSAKAAQWIAVHAGGWVRNPFQNPLRQNHGHALAVREATGDRVPVVGLVVFAGTARFGKAGMPDGVVTLSGLRAAVTALEALNPPRAGVATAWDALLMELAGQDRKAMARAHAATRKAAAARAGSKAAEDASPRRR